MSQNKRLASGGRIDRKKVINFSFDGKSYKGFEGDTLASALLANGVDIIARSFKYSRPRGITGHGSEEPNGVIQLGTGASTIPNVRATQQELYAGLVANPVAGWPSVNFDLMATLGKAGAMMPPGFYYKTFMYPQKLWMTYEHFIRKAAGLGKAPTAPDPDTYDKINHHCDVMIVGAGPAGLSAALAAAKTGARVIIADEQNEMGGSLLSTTQTIDGAPASQWLQDTIETLEDYSNVIVLPRSTVMGYYDHNFLVVIERRTDHLGEISPRGARQRMHRVRAKQVILAPGAQERPLIFANNDIPGVMLASSISVYLNRYAVAPGNALVVSTANDSGYQAAIDWHKAGRKVIGIADSRAESNGELVEEAKKLGLKIWFSHAVIEAKGSRRVYAATVAPINAEGTQVTGASQNYDCDIIATSGGWSPVVHLSCHTGARPVWNDDIIGFLPGKTVQKQHCVGSLMGQHQLHDTFEQGLATGAQAACEAGFGDGSNSIKVPSVDLVKTGQAQALFLVPHSKSVSRAPKQFVDMQNDVTAAGIELATREGFESIEHVKRYTALGFGTDQGKLGNINGMAVAAQSLNKTIAETGTTIFRPSYTPTTFGAIAGRDTDSLFDPIRYTAMQSWHEANGALFEDVGQWKRPWYFPKPGETMQQTLDRECLATRNSVGILDASTLGKIDIQGKDAREFLNRVYTNAWSKLAVGKCRYGLMLKEDGMIMDDGVTSCIADDHFILTTTTGGAANVLEWLELWHQTEWPELEVYMTSVTDHWSTMTISGPNSRKVLAKVCDDIDLDKDSFKFMDWRSGTVAGVKSRVFRISFTGELSYEINVQANHGLHVWEAIMEAGKEFDITPYGTETMHVLRAEKGFIIVGQDTDGSVTPQDMDMSWCIGKNKEFSFIGKRSFTRPDTSRTDRKQFVGLKPKDANVILPEGAQAVRNPNESIPMTMVGHVTSSYYSAVLGHSFALAVIKDGHNRKGESVYFPLADGRTIEAEITDYVFYDAKGEKQHV
ncbi:sarcosine oxidase subunit alpha [Marinomonas sp. SBI22]|uniref:sarcosine oxidase subunit alpha n=1 Tax=unclassified Marinomonas TaxID=196814 RepID=UPI0007AF6AF5|nr:MULTISPECIES: sarcosine oxidase subunit alpha [unclassified Marinomonas]KZM40084.1 sarcosine oxidase subunit alpha [Marinomonas sp. SBI22]KZM41378.1 sarcosine oxidase subunit alpha [Marinomonas sp. SBI8L]